MTDKLRAAYHGEAIFYEMPITRIQADWDKARVITFANNSDEFVNSTDYIVANSETSGNHHVVTLDPTDEVRGDLERCFLAITGERKVNCVQPGRHGTITLPKPKENHVWVKSIAQEKDWITQERRNVAD